MQIVHKLNFIYQYMQQISYYTITTVINDNILLYNNNNWPLVYTISILIY